MINLFYLTILGSLLSIFLIALKNTFIKKYGGVWYYYIWILVLICHCFPYKIDILQYFTHEIQYQQKSIEDTAILNNTLFHSENNTIVELEQNDMSSTYHTIPLK